MNNHQTAKRYSCDRCRDQKLRCTRSQSGDSPCDRCLRLGALCVTGSGRPLGRHSLHVSQASSAHIHGNPPANNARRSRTPARRGLRVSAPPSSNPLPSPPPHSYPALVASEPHSPEMSSLFAHAPPHCDVMLNLGLDEPEFLHNSSSSRSSSLAFSAGPPQFSPNSSSLPDLDFGNMGDLAKSLNKGFHNSPGDADDLDSAQSETSMSKVPVSNDSMAFLTGMVGNISRQLVELRNQSWESWGSYLAQAALFDGHASTMTCSGSVDLNPLDNALWVTSRFAWVLQMMAPPQFSTNPSAYSPPTLSMTLMLLSTYIQVGELFYTILTRIANCLHEGPGQSELLSLAVAPVAGKPIPARLQITMMMQAFEQQLHTVESLMGFPAHHRLWGWQDTGAGILNQEKSSVLTQAMMGQVQETFHSLKRTIDSIHSSLRLSTSSTPSFCEVMP